MPDKQRRTNTAKSNARNLQRITNCAARTLAPQWLEALETRTLMSVSTDSAGWTVVGPASDTRVIYVSSRYGNDSNNGLSASSAVRTLARGQALVRDGSADWLMLRRGDTFDTFGDWRKSGRSAQEPIYISAYGEGARPQINSGTGAGFITYQRGSSSINNVIIQSIAFKAHTYNHFNGNGFTAGIRLTSSGRNWTIEDVLVDGYKDNVVFDAASGQLRNVTLRRSVIVDAHSAESMSNGKAQGLYIGPNSDGILIEQNVFDHNGWRRGVNSDRIVYNHNIYSKNGARNVVVQDNIISRGSFYGLKFNSGGVARNNLFIRNSEAIYLEESATVEGNVITEAVNMPNMGWGVGINTQKAGSATIRNNLIAHTLASSGGGPVAGIQLFNNGTPFSGLIEGNIVYNWHNGLLVQTRGAGSGSVRIRGNHFQVPGHTNAVHHMSSAPVSAFVYENNVYSAGGRSDANRLNGTGHNASAWNSKTGEKGARFETIAYPDAGRTIARYSSEVAGAGRSFEAFIEAARQTHRSNWNANLTAARVNPWFYQGFGVGGSSGGQTGGGSSGNSGNNNGSNGNSGNNNGGSNNSGGGNNTGNTGNSGNTGGNNSGGSSGGSNTTPPPVPVTTPRVVEAVLDVNQLPKTLSLTFSTGVGRSINRDQLVVIDLQSGLRRPVRSVSYVAKGDTAHYRLSDLPEGYYRALLPAGSVFDSKGVRSTANQAWDFHVLSGDANRDRRVNIHDFSILASNFARRGSFSQGDFDYSGRIDRADVEMLLARFHSQVNLVTADGASSVQWRGATPAPAAPTKPPVGTGGFGERLTETLLPSDKRLI